MADSDFCSVKCLEAGEPLMATAPRTDVWLALETAGRWGHQALKESDLPDSTKNHIAAFQDAVATTRVVLIKREQPQPSDGIMCYLAVSQADPPRLYQFRLPHIEALEDIDLPRVAAGDSAYADHLMNQPVYLVCTHGKRDPCCATFGLPVYLALKDQVTDVWQCTHLGGHRFAGNLVSLPDGAYYGRLSPQTALAALRDIQQGNIPLEAYRGRGRFEQPVQAAEALVRERLGERRLSALRLLRVDEPEPDSWMVRFEHDSGSISLRIARRPAGYAIHDSCAAEKAVDVVQYHLEEMAQGA
jgi:hypothetical protein